MKQVPVLNKHWKPGGGVSTGNLGGGEDYRKAN